MSKRKNKLTANDWLDTALQVLAEQGLEAVAVEPLAKRMGVTKGSFYWHFKNRNVLLSELLQFWENIELAYLAATSAKTQAPKAFLKEILTLLIEDDTNKRVFLALSNSTNNDDVANHYQRAVARRIEIFQSTYLALGCKKDKANKYAQLTYFSYLGLIKSLVDKTVNNDPKLIKSVIKTATDV